MDPAREPLILFLVTHFHDGDRVSAFVDDVLQSSDAGTGHTVAVAVADNSPDVAFDFVPRPNLAVFPAPSNLGYLNGCAFALERWIDEGRPTPRWVAVSNTDMTLDGRFREAVAVLDLPADVGVVAPDIRLPDGTPQNPFMVRRPSRRRLVTYRFAFRSRVLTSAMRLLESARLTGRKTTTARMPARDIYAAHGSLFLLSASFQASSATLGYDGFMYGEELHVAEQARRHGLRIVTAPTLVAHHTRRSSTGLIGRSERRLWARESLSALVRRYYDPS